MFGTVVLQTALYFFVLTPPREMFLQTLAVLWGVRCPCGQGRVTAKLSFLPAFEAFKIHLSFQIPTCRLGNAFPRGGAKLLKEESSLKR